MDRYIHRQNLALLRKRLTETQDEKQREVILKLLAEEEAKDAPLRRGVEYTLMQLGPSLWKWQFQIDDTVTTGRTQTKLKGMAATRAEVRIDRELKRLRELES